MKNGFLSSANKTAAHLIANCQTFMAGSLGEIANGELQHVQQIAEMYFKSNEPMAESERIVRRNSPFFGGKTTHEVESFPMDRWFEGKMRSSLADFQLAKIDWGAGKTIESIRFTMSNGDQSPKYGKKPFSANCEFDSRVTKIISKVKNNHLVSLNFWTEKDGDYFTIEGEDADSAGSSTTVELHQLESLIGFQMRLSAGVLHGLNYTILTT